MTWITSSIWLILVDDDKDWYFKKQDCLKYRDFIETGTAWSFLKVMEFKNPGKLNLNLTRCNNYCLTTCPLMTSGVYT